MSPNPRPPNGFEASLAARALILTMSGMLHGIFARDNRRRRMTAPREVMSVRIRVSLQFVGGNPTVLQRDEAIRP